jgi:hypothetical protein
MIIMERKADTPAKVALLMVASVLIFCSPSMLAQALVSTGSSDPLVYADMQEASTWSPATAIGCLLDSYNLDIVGSDIDASGGPHYISSNCESFLIQGNIVMTIGRDSYLWFRHDLTFSGVGQGKIVIEPGATLRISDDLIVSGNGEIVIQPGGILIVGGDALVSGTIDLNANGLAQIGGNLIISGSPSLIFNGIVQVAESVYQTNPNGKSVKFTTTHPASSFILNGGSLDCRLQIAGTGCDYWQGPAGSCCQNMTLPVELLGFSGRSSGDAVELDWSTASETNNDYFTIERSQDGISFEPIGRVSGNGTVHRASEYQFVDRRPAPGTAYYRLMQTDFDGTSEVLSVIAVQWILGAGSMSVFPNPLRDNRLTVQMGGLIAFGSADLQIVDATGRIVHRETMAIGAGGHLQQDVLLGVTLKKGIYIVALQQSQLSGHTRLIVL